MAGSGKLIALFGLVFFVATVLTSIVVTPVQAATSSTSIGGAITALMEAAGR